MNTKPVKVLYVIDSYANPNAGTEGQLYQLIKHIDREKFSPQLLVLNQSEWLDNNEFPCAFETLGASSIKSIKTWLLLHKKAKAYRQQGIKLAHVYFNDASVLCPPVFKLNGIQTFISRRDMGYWYNRVYKIILPITGMCISRALVNAKAVGDITHKVEKIPENKISVIYNGYEQSTEQLAEVPELINFKADATLLGIVANIRTIKRMQDAIQVIAKLQDTFNVKLVIIGGGDASELSELCEQHNVRDKVLFMGSRTDIRNCLQHLDIGLLCSESEGFSNAIVEYQFSGLPVVCSRVGGNPEAVTHGENGFLYEAGNQKDLKQQLDIMLEKPDLMKEMSKNARLTAENNYTIQNMIELHQKHYLNTLGSNNA